MRIITSGWSAGKQHFVLPYFECSTNTEPIGISQTVQASCAIFEMRPMGAVSSPTEGRKLWSKARFSGQAAFGSFFVCGISDSHAACANDRAPSAKLLGVEGSLSHGASVKTR